MFIKRERKPQSLTLPCDPGITFINPHSLRKVPSPVTAELRSFVSLFERKARPRVFFPKDRKKSTKS